MKKNTEFNKWLNVTTKDILPLIYFIISMFQQENVHKQGTSSKSDLIGGYIDRWINKLPENLIFNKMLLKDKNYKVVNDYFIYGAKSDKNAPDILGLKTINRLIKFAEFNNDTWEMCPGMPHIEVKTFRKNQKLVSVRDTQLEDDIYYVFVESNFEPDYLIRLFAVEALDAKLANIIFMNSDFIKNNDYQILKQPQKIKVSTGENIGYLRLISIIKGNDYKKHSVFCKEKESIYYLNSITEHQGKIPQINAYEKKTPKEQLNISLKDYFKKSDFIWNNKKIIPFNIDHPEYIIIKKINKESLFVLAKKDCNLYETELKKDKVYKIKLSLFERSSKWNEYIILKNQCPDIYDRREELVKKFDEIVESLEIE